MPIKGSFASGSVAGFGGRGGSGPPYFVQYLIVGGGGTGAAGYGAGGGGAGGFRTIASKTIQVLKGKSYTVTVGSGGGPAGPAGGAPAGPSEAGPSSSGGDSSFAAEEETITSAGGGGTTYGWPDGQKTNEIHLLYHLHKEVLAEMHNQLNIQITALEAAEEEHQLLEIMEQHLEQVDLLQEMVVVEQHLQ
jgi:hypothetical protein